MKFMCSTWRNFIKNAEPLSSIMIGILFATLCLVILGGGVFAIEASEIKLADYIQIVIMFFIAGTMFVGLRSHNHEKKYSQSETNLESALSLISRSAQVLQVGGALTNDRVAWVTCARLIARAEALRGKITTETHKLIFDAEHDFQRHSFRELLKVDGKELTGAFFCGGDSTMSIGETVTSPAHPADGRDWIPERILNVIYTFISFPEEYRDPLRASEKMSPKIANRLQHLGHEGVTDYLNFRRKFQVLGKDIRNKSTLVKASNAEDIDDELFLAKWDSYE